MVLQAVKNNEPVSINRVAAVPSSGFRVFMASPFVRGGGHPSPHQHAVSQLNGFRPKATAGRIPADIIPV